MREIIRKAMGEFGDVCGFETDIDVVDYCANRSVGGNLLTRRDQMIATSLQFNQNRFTETV